MYNLCSLAVYHFHKIRTSRYWDNKFMSKQIITMLNSGYLELYYQKLYLIFLFQIMCRIQKYSLFYSQLRFLW